MAIADFDADGLLPSGPHDCVEADVKLRLVDSFVSSTTRGPIHDRWLQHRLALAEFLTIQEQWVDGSFVTDKEDPGDIDIVTLFDGPAFDGLLEHRQMMVETLVSGKYTSRYWASDSYPLAVYPDGHPKKNLTDATLAYWDDWFGHTRGGKEKGYLKVAP